MSVIRAQSLAKRYGETNALDGFDLNVQSGRIVGLIGPNGSGKTTALKSILGLCELDSGELSVLDRRPASERAALMRKVAYIADTGILPRWMRVKELIDYTEGVHPSFDRSAALRALERTDIRLNARVRTLSKGMHVQLHLALILAIDAELLVLDEPTLGLDILYRQQFYDAVLNDFYTEARSILVTTHEVREIEHILTDVVFIHRGKARLAISMDELPNRYTKVTAKQAIDAGREPLHAKQTLNGFEYIFEDADRDVLEPFGALSTPNLAELFVAVVEERA